MLFDCLKFHDCVKFHLISWTVLGQTASCCYCCILPTGNFKREFHCSTVSFLKLKIVFNSLFDVRCNATVHFPASCSYLELSIAVVKVQPKYVPPRSIGFDFSDVAFNMLKEQNSCSSAR